MAARAALVALARCLWVEAVAVAPPSIAYELQVLAAIAVCEEQVDVAPRIPRMAVRRNKMLRARLGANSPLAWELSASGSLPRVLLPNEAPRVGGPTHGGLEVRAR